MSWKSGNFHIFVTVSVTTLIIMTPRKNLQLADDTDDDKQFLLRLGWNEENEGETQSQNLPELTFEESE